MASKIAAARIANAAGCAMIICRGDHDHPIAAIRAGARHSWFAPNGNPESARRAWILGSLARESLRMKSSISFPPPSPSRRGPNSRFWII